MVGVILFLLLSLMHGMALGLGDVNGDCSVDLQDIVAVITEWGPCPSLPAVCAADLNHDMLVNLIDITLVLGAWGSACPTKTTTGAPTTTTPSPTTAAGSVVQVSLTGVSFVPNNFTVNIGDTIVFNWVSGFHGIAAGLCPGPTNTNKFPSIAPNGQGSPNTAHLEITAAAFNSGDIVQFYCTIHSCPMSATFRVL